MLKRDLKIETYELNDVNDMYKEGNFTYLCRVTGEEILKQRRENESAEREVPEERL